MKSNCLSVLLFNLESMPLSQTDLNKLKFSIFRAFMKIFHITDTTAVAWCQFYTNFLPVNFLIDARKIKYYRKMFVSKCHVMQHLYNNSAKALATTLYCNYGVPENISNNKFMSTLWHKFHDLIINENV